MTLLAAVLLLLLSTGRCVLPLTAWLSPLFLLRFVREGRAWPRLAMGGAALYLTGCLTWWGIVPVPAPGYFAIMLSVLLPMLLPYVVDRLARKAGAGFSTTLIFPCAWVVTDYVISRTSPYGTWGLVAYTQVDHLPLVQSAAVAGLWGIGFLIAWTASVANWAWERGFQWPRVSRGVATWAALLGLVLLLGGARLAFSPPTSPTVRVASFTIPPAGHLSPWSLISRERKGAALDSLRGELRAHHDTLFSRVLREARAGARIVMWSEAGAFVLADEQEAFEREAGAVAREAGVLLVTGNAVFTPGAGYYENLLVAFDSTGARLAKYHKARPVPGDPERGADKAIPVFETSLGRVAGAVCFDADFPDLIGRAGRERAHLLLVPSSDWRAIDPIHTRMALMRGIENGCSVVRQTNKGLSAAADHQGRVLAATDFFRTTPCVMVAEVPARGVRTPYSRLPNLLPLASALALLVLVAKRLAERLPG